MKKNPIEALFAVIAENAARREKIAQEIEDLKLQEQALEAEAVEAAKDDNVDLYMQKRGEKEKLSAEIYVRGFQIDKVPAVTKEQAVAAWNAYAEDYNAELKKAVAKFNATKETLCRTYAEMVDLQNDALTIRNKLGAVMGIKGGDGYGTEGVETLFRMDYMPHSQGVEAKGLLMLGGVPGTKDPDAVYYLSNCCRKDSKHMVAINGHQDPDAAKIVAVVAAHSAYK